MESFELKQKRVVQYIQSSRSLVESVWNAHLAGRFELLYPSSSLASDKVISVLTESRASMAAKNIREQKGVVHKINNEDELIRLSLLKVDSGIPENWTPADQLGYMQTMGHLLCNQLEACMDYLSRLENRVLDPTSRVLVTGDVNAGKSTLVNALMRREIVPVDQQPCTQCFCEISQNSASLLPESSFMVNDHIVHAVRDFSRYNLHEPSTFEMVDLDSMRQMIQDDCTDYQMFHVLLKENLLWPALAVEHASYTNPQKSAVDVHFVDSPGLNSDMIKTTSLFSKQEDIDAIVFVINACNHLTLSARQFLEAASKEKTRIFVVVNKFDEVRDKRKCQRQIMAQIEEVLPRTFEEQKELVHFVSASEFLRQFNQAPLFPMSLDSYSEDQSDQEAASLEVQGDLKCHAENLIESFCQAESSLCRFILQRRIHSKLFPAQTYVTNLLSELRLVLCFNAQMHKSRLADVEQELDIMSPCLDELQRHNGPLQKDLDAIETEAHGKIRAGVLQHLSQFDSNLIVEETPWAGVFSCSAFCRNVHRHILRRSEVFFERGRLAAERTLQSAFNSLISTAAAHAPLVYSDKDDGDVAGGDLSLAISCPSIVGLEMNIWQLIRMGGGRLWSFGSSSRDGLSTTGVLAALTGTAVTALVAKPWRLGLDVLVRLVSLQSNLNGNSLMQLVVGVGGLCAVVILGSCGLIFAEAENLLRDHLNRHYAQFFGSFAWQEHPADEMGRQCLLKLSSLSSRLISRFEEALHTQRQAVSSKDLQRCQLQTMVSFFDTQIVKIGELFSQAVIS